MLQDFDSEVDIAPTRVVREVPIIDVTTTVATTVTSTVEAKPTVVAPVEQRKDYVGTASSAWDWRALRDYVVTQIEQRFGQFPRDPKKEASVFGRFVKDWGGLAGPIAEFAFNNADGWWMGAPISVNRFCRASDPFFAGPIAEKLLEALDPPASL